MERYCKYKRIEKRVKDLIYLIKCKKIIDKCWTNYCDIKHYNSMKWVCLFMSIRLKRNFQKTMRKYGTLDKTHTNRVRMVLSFATNVRKDKDKPIAAKCIEWFL